MSKRLHVVLRDSEYLEIQKVTRSRHLTIAEWVRQAIAVALSREQSVDIDRKLEVVRAAVRHDFPAGEIDAMLAEIARGR
jgi:hypothetical protein